MFYEYRYLTIILGFIFFILFLICLKYQNKNGKFKIIHVLKIPILIIALGCFGVNNAIFDNHDHKLRLISEYDFMQKKIRKNDIKQAYLKQKLAKLKDTKAIEDKINIDKLKGAKISNANISNDKIIKKTITALKQTDAKLSDDKQVAAKLNALIKQNNNE